ncbi:ANTAR domain-containing protein [Mycolicibacterium sp. HS_4_1]
MDPALLSVAQALTDVATIALLQERAIRERDLLTEQLQAALNSQLAVEQAKGVVAERANVTIDEASTNGAITRTYTTRNWPNWPMRSSGMTPLSPISPICRPAEAVPSSLLSWCHRARMPLADEC